MVVAAQLLAILLVITLVVVGALGLVADAQAAASQLPRENLVLERQLVVAFFLLGGVLWRSVLDLFAIPLLL